LASQATAEFIPKSSVDTILNSEWLAIGIDVRRSLWCRRTMCGGHAVSHTEHPK
jgi:hypothetical protein